MGKDPTTREQLATVVEQNKNQNILLAEMKDNLKKHEEVSETYRRKTVANEICIKAIKHETIPPIRKGLYGLYGIIGLIIVGVTVAYFTK